MSEYGFVKMPPSVPEQSRKASIVGIGETDYFSDYQAERQRSEGWEPPTQENLAQLAFERALADSGLNAKDIDGLALSFTYGAPDPDKFAKQLGLSPRKSWLNGHIMAGPLPAACGEITSGEHDIIALVYGVTPRSAGRLFGGSSTHVPGQGGPSSYFYYHPWGFSSQAAHWAMMATYYQNTYNASEADIGSVAVQIRQHAMADPNAVMQKALDIEGYLASRYIVRPLHLFDMCMVNDGAVCLILSRADLAQELAHTPVDVAGWGESYVKSSKLDIMVRQRLRPIMQDAVSQAFAMSGLNIGDVQHFEGYDASSIHLINQIEGYGFTEAGTGLEFCKAGQLSNGGRVPTNTSGGNMSGSYMHGWSQIAEVVKQLRHEAGPRQIEGIEVSLSALTQTDAAHPILFQRGA